MVTMMYYIINNDRLLVGNDRVRRPKEKVNGKTPNRKKKKATWMRSEAREGGKAKLGASKLRRYLAALACGLMVRSQSYAAEWKG
jgi:hypothetical protein